MIIGNLDLGDRPVLLAPMEDVTDIGFVCFVASLVLRWFTLNL